MKKWVRQLALLVFLVSAGLQVWSGHWYQGLLIWSVGLIGLVYLDKRIFESRVQSVLPKLYVCAKPEEYLEWLEDLHKEMVFKHLFDEKLKIYQYSGWLYEVGRPKLPKEVLKTMVWDAEKKGRFQDPAAKLEGLLLSPSNRYRSYLNGLYHLWINGPEAVKTLPFEDLKEKMTTMEAAISEQDKEKDILRLIGKLLLGKWAFTFSKQQEAERIFSELRETEVFNLMFGEVNYHLSLIEKKKKQWEKAAYYQRVAQNFADETALEVLIQSE